MEQPQLAHPTRHPFARATALGALRILATLLVAWPCAAGPHAPASAEAALDDDEMRVRGTLVADWQAAGQARLGVLFEPDPGWHLYWRNPGDTGLAPRFSWELGDAATGDVAWPLPQRFHDAELDATSYGYEGEVLLALPVRWDPRRPAPSRASVRADVLVCDHLCIPGVLELSLPFPRAPDPASAALFDRWQRRLPVSAPQAGIETRLVRSPTRGEGGRIQFEVDVEQPPCASGDAACPPSLQGVLAAAEGSFYPLRDAALDGVTARVEDLGDGDRLRVAVDAELSDATAGDGSLAGVLVLSGGASRRGIELSLPWRTETPRRAASSPSSSALPAPPSASQPPPPARGLRLAELLRAALAGFLGGLLLNLMPCVLPVLALKVFALAELASRSRRETLWHAGAYTAGILAAMALLAAVVIGLRAAGAAVGWGFHLQEPVFVAAVCALLVAFALNLFGVFEIQIDTTRLASLGAGAVGSRRSFFDGLLAVVLATPCSAPFLGTAVGFAFASSGFVIASVFAAIGLGLAAPFALVAAVPSWGSRLPRSGPWMLHLRAGLGFALLGSVVWLLWVLGRAAGSDALAGTLALLVAVAMLVWGFGLLQRLGRPPPVPALLAALLLTLSGGIDLLDFSPAQARPVADRLAETGVTPWSEARVQAVLAEGRPAFVYFTADWCITCKLNESRVLEDPIVAERFRALGIPVFRADWTRRDDTIRQALADLGKAGVPAYALYQPGDPKSPLLLPELLSVSGLVSSLEQASLLASGGIRRADLAPGSRDSDTRS